MAREVRELPVLKGKAARDFYKQWAKATESKSAGYVKENCLKWKAYFEEQERLHPRSPVLTSNAGWNNFLPPQGQRLNRRTRKENLPATTLRCLAIKIYVLRYDAMERQGDVLKRFTLQNESKRVNRFSKACTLFYWIILQSKIEKRSLRCWFTRKDEYLCKKEEVISICKIGD